MHKDQQPSDEARAPALLSAFMMVHLPGLLPSGHVLVLHRGLSLLLCLACAQEEPQLHSIVPLTQEDLRVLLPLLLAFPAYARYAVVLASLKAIPLAQAHEQVEQARQAGEATWTTLLHPLRTTLSSVRWKLHPCGVEIVAARQRGYLLSRWKEAPAP